MQVNVSNVAIDDSTASFHCGYWLALHHDVVNMTYWLPWNIHSITMELTTVNTCNSRRARSSDAEYCLQLTDLIATTSTIVQITVGIAECLSSWLVDLTLVAISTAHSCTGVCSWGLSAWFVHNTNEWNHKRYMLLYPCQQVLIPRNDLVNGKSSEYE